VISLTEGRSKTRRDGSDCERKFFYDSLPKNKVGVCFISKPKIQLNFWKLQRQSDGKNNTVGAQTILTLIPMQQESQGAIEYL